MATELDIRSQVSMAELAKRSHNGLLQNIVEMLARPFSIYADAAWTEANNIFSHVTTQRVSEPQGSERDINEGAAITASQTKQIEDTLCLIEDWSEIDEILVAAASNPRQFRADEDIAHWNGMRKRFASRYFAGNMSTDRKQINGLENRADYMTLGTGYVYDNANGATPSVTANKTSIWIVRHNTTDGVCCGYPRGQNMGINQEDKGKVTLTTGASNELRHDVWQTKMSLRFGLVIRHKGAVRRIVNLSMTNQDEIDDFDFNENLLISALTEMQADGQLDASTVIYMHPSTQTRLWIRAKDKGNVWWDKDNAFGVPILRFWQTPIHTDDAISIVASKITT